MRASTLFAITLSVLLGLGAVAGARYAGLFDKKETPATLPDPPVTLSVLIPITNLYQDVAVTSEYVQTKQLQLNEEEAKEYRKDPTKYASRYIHGVPSAIQFRIPKLNIPAGTPLKEEMFQKQELPRPISEQLEPKTVPVNVKVSKANSVGGTIRKDEYVDVWLSTTFNVGTGKEAKETPVSACLAKGCKVIMKRDSIWTSFGSDPDDKPISFTLQTNPYRAALIEFARSRGTLSFRTASAPATAGTGKFSNDSPEYLDEDIRVDKINRSEYAISDLDLMRVFNLKIPVTVPPPPAPEPIKTRVIVGTQEVGTAQFDREGRGSSYEPAAKGGAAPAASPKGQVVPFSFGPRGKQNAEECVDCKK
jgi:Flp pilus assembly protein CpaB